MRWAAAMLASLVSTLEQPMWWVLGLASFLIRGGLLLLLLPIVALPTPAGLQNALADELGGFIFGSPSARFIAFVITAIMATTAWLIFGGLLAAWTDVALVAAVAGSWRLGIEVRGGTWLAWRVLAIRLVSMAPLAIALSWGIGQIVEAAYAEYLHPGDLAVPVVARVASRVPEVIALVLVAWLAGEAGGGLAIRYLVLNRMRTSVALLRGWLNLVLRPSTLATLLLTVVAMVAATAGTAVVAGGAWDRLRGLLAERAEPLQIAVALVALAAAWLTGLLIVAMVMGWRSAAWTFEVVRREGHP
jgi:hypothetical protein